MTYNTVLSGLLVHIGSTCEPVLIGWDSAQQWPLGALECLVQAGILKSASTAQSIECNACEHHCYMDVLMQLGEGDAVNRAFIVCDVPEMQSQMGRVQISLERLQQWRTGFKQLAGVIAGLLSIDGHIECKPEQVSISLGMLKSKGGWRWASLSNQPLMMEINEFKVPVCELLFIENGKLIIDESRIDELLNLSPVNSVNKYIPDVSKRESQKAATRLMYQDWQDAYNELKDKNPSQNISWICRKISKMPMGKNKDPAYIRRKIKS